MRKEIDERIDELKEMIEDHALDLEEKDECREELKSLNKALASGRVATATGGARFEDKETRNPRQTVSKAVENPPKHRPSQSKRARPQSPKQSRNSAFPRCPPVQISLLMPVIVQC